MSIFSNFLKLFKYEPITDKQNTFNIQTALNDNWDKVDDFSMDVSQKLEEKADLVNGKVPNNQLPEISSNAEDITITDTAGNFTATNVEGALAELFQSANDGKTAIRNAISAKGVTVSLEDTFTLLASKIVAQMCKFGGTATVTDVLTGKTFINNSGEILTGIMANQGDKSATLNAGGSYTIPAGYHNGSGVISANNLAGQTSGTAGAANILSAYTAWVDGVKITGTMTNNGAVSQTLTTQGGSYTIPAGYHNGSGKVTANISNLVAENVKQGVNVGGILGNYGGQLKFDSGTIPASTLSGFVDNKTIVSSIKPLIVIMLKRTHSNLRYALDIFEVGQSNGFKSTIASKYTLFGSGSFTLNMINNQQQLQDYNNYGILIKGVSGNTITYGINNGDLSADAPLYWFAYGVE